MNDGKRNSPTLLHYSSPFSLFKLFCRGIILRIVNRSMCVYKFNYLKNVRHASNGRCRLCRIYMLFRSVQECFIIGGKSIEWMETAMVLASFMYIFHCRSPSGPGAFGRLPFKADKTSRQAAQVGDRTCDSHLQV